MVPNVSLIFRTWRRLEIYNNISWVLYLVGPLSRWSFISWVLYLFGPLSLRSFISWVLYLFGPLSHWSFISWVLYLFGHCIVCHSIRSFELPLWYLWAFLNCSESLFVYLSSPSVILCLPIKRIGSRIYYCINILICTTYTYSLIELKINSYKIQ